MIPIDPSVVTPPTNDWPKIRNDAQNRGCACGFGRLPNHPPVAYAGPDETVECTGGLAATVVLDGSSSTDLDSTAEISDLVLYEWFEDFGVPWKRALGAGKTLETPLGLGTHAITLRVTDRGGLTDTDDVVETIADTLPPRISVVLNPAVLWPPNHRLVDAQATVATSDVCGGTQIVLAAVTSSEPDDAPGAGDGSTMNDIQRAELGTPDFTYQLRAERSRRGPGRIYTATYIAIDSAGLQATAAGVTTVPHDRRGKTMSSPMSRSRAPRPVPFSRGRARTTPSTTPSSVGDWTSSATPAPSSTLVL